MLTSGTPARIINHLIIKIQYTHVRFQTVVFEVGSGFGDNQPFNIDLKKKNKKKKQTKLWVK
jgi:hypothetical protein